LDKMTDEIVPKQIFGVNQGDAMNEEDFGND
jgi:hypothetical protein